LQSLAEGLSRVKFSMANAFRHLADVVQGVTLSQTDPIWLLGTFYGVHNHDTGTDGLGPEAAEAFMKDFKSRIWITYRTGFPTLGPSNLTSDVGWGCTLRSGQMMLAEALLRHVKGRSWTTGSSTDDVTPDPELLQLLGLFADTASAPLSLHNICSAGTSHGVVPGKWLGPWVLCKALEALVNGSQPHGLQVHVVCDPGGGAPALDVQHVRSVFKEAAGAAAVSTSGTTATAEAEAEAAGIARHVSSDDQQQSGAGPGPATADSEAANGEAPGSAEPVSKQAGPGATCESCEDRTHGNAGDGSGSQSSTGLLLLLPLTLGVGKANPLYYPQLLEVLAFPQSVGIIGGRPASSLFFVGHQAGNLVYLDPHEPQPAAQLPAALPTYFCPTVRLMPIASMDPSLAIGFYCSSRDDFDDLAQRLATLSQQHRKAPIVTMAGSSGSSAANGGERLVDGVLSEDLDEEADDSGSLVSRDEADGMSAGVGSPPDGNGMLPGSGLRTKGSRRHEDWELV